MMLERLNRLSLRRGYVHGRPSFVECLDGPGQFCFLDTIRRKDQNAKAIEPFHGFPSVRSEAIRDILLPLNGRPQTPFPRTFDRGQESGRQVNAMALSRCDNPLCLCIVTEHSTGQSYCSDACRHQPASAKECKCGHPECKDHDAEQTQICVCSASWSL